MNEFKINYRISYNEGHVRAEIDLTKYGERFVKAQELLGENVLQSCKTFMPFVTGNMQQRSSVEYDHLTNRSHVENGGRRVVFPGPYARYLYDGKVMVDSVTGKGPRKIPTGPGEYVLRYRKDAKLVPTGRPLTYTKTYNPQATDHWFDHAKAKFCKEWVESVKRVITKGE